MMDWKDKERYSCLVCGHTWIIISDELITEEQHDKWMAEVQCQHGEVHNDPEKK